MFKKISLILIGSIISVILFELFLRFSPFEYGLTPVEYDSEIGMWHKKDYSNYAIKECYKTKYEFDKNGLPKSIIPYDKSKKDIVILGDSYIEAIMVKNKNIIHNSLSREYINKYNFLNYGLSGSSPTQQFVITKEKVDLKNTKYITQFVFLEGDLLDVDSKNLGALKRPKVYVEFDSLYNYKIIPPRQANLYDKIGDFMGNFQLYTYIKKSLYYIKDKLKSEKVNNENNKVKIKKVDLTKNWLYLKGAIYQINKLSKENNIKFNVIVVSENNKNIDIIKKFFAKYSINHTILNYEINFKLKGFSCDAHWNDQTHKNIAKYLKSINFYN